MKKEILLFFTIMIFCISLAIGANINSNNSEELPIDNFITTWKTDNPGSSNSTSITIPTLGSGYNYSVDWESDGVIDTVGVTGTITFDYTTAGTYQVTISGDFPRIHFNNSGDKNKILSIDQWGTEQWSSMQNAFSGCSNLGLNQAVPATDSPNLSNVSNMYGMFKNCSSFNEDIDSWDVQTITNMRYLFSGTTNFNQDLSNWDVSGVTDLSYMFFNATNFDGNISNWNVGLVQNFSAMFLNASSFNQPINQNDSLNYWNVSNGTSMVNMFHGASSFNQDLSLWDVSNVTNMKDMFHGASLYGENANWDLDNWDVGLVTNMSYMFYQAPNFNQSIGSWDVTSVLTMNRMFRFATSFNQPLNNWIVNSVTDMSYMFSSATDFNQDLHLWDVNNVTNMSGMFYTAINFNGSLSDWDISNVVSMAAMFCNASSFNQPINYDSLNNHWNTGQVTSMYKMFYGASSFNQDIGNWNTGQVSNMSYLFSMATSFNQNIEDWDVSNATDMKWMFYKAENFNQELKNWEPDNVISMYRMFYRAYDFNQNLGSWNINSVTDMRQMFLLAPISTLNYDQTLIGWLNSYNPNNNTQLSGGDHYCMGKDARDILDDYWTIGDNGQECINYCNTLTSDPASPFENLFIKGTQLQIGYNSTENMGNFNFSWSSSGGAINCSDCPNPIIHTIPYTSSTFLATITSNGFDCVTGIFTIEQQKVPHYIFLSKNVETFYGVNDGENINFRFDYKKYIDGDSLLYEIYDKNHFKVTSNASLLNSDLKYGVNVFSLDVSNLVSGVYILEVASDEDEKLYARFKID